MANWQDYWKKQAKGPKAFNLGPSPYTSDGYRRDELLDEIFDPSGASRYRAENTRTNLDKKEYAMGLPKIDDVPWYESLFNNPAVKAVGWLGTQIDRPFNAIEGMLEETRDQNQARTEEQGPMGFLDSLKAAGTGIKQGFTHEKDYNLGRYMEKVFSDGSPDDSEGNILEEIIRMRPFLPFVEPGKDARWGKSGPQEDPEYGGLKNATVGDLLGFATSLKASFFPAKVGRVTQSGEEIASALGKTSKATGVADDALRTVPRGTASGSSILESVLGEGFMDDLFGTPAHRAAPELPATLPPAVQRKALQVWNPLAEGGWSTPLKNQQFALYDKIGQGSKDFLGKSPGLERFLSHFSNRIESSATPGGATMIDDIDNSRLGYKAANTNFDERYVQAIKDAGVELTDNEQIALYHARTSGKSLDDPEFLQALQTHYRMPAEELQGISAKLEGPGNWWKQEATDFAAKGEAAGILNPMQDDYMPVRFKKELDPGMMDSVDDSLGKEFSGLRGIQKHRQFDAVRDWEKLIQHGAAGDLAFNRFDDATQYYSRVFHGLERRRNLLQSLQKSGVVSTQRKDGFSPLADVLGVEPGAQTAVPRGTPPTNPGGILDELMPNTPPPAVPHGTSSTIQPQEYFINERLKQRFVDEIFGYGGKRSPILQGISKAQDPWKFAVTMLNPRWHVANVFDDLVRNFGLGDVTTDAYKAATRQSDNIWSQGTNVRDWVKNNYGQWEFAPGTNTVMDLTERDATLLSNRMGASTVETSEIANSGKSLLRRGADRLERAQGVSRDANFVQGLKDKGDSAFAKQIVDQDLINYRDISPFVRDVVRPFAPFTTFRIKNPQVAMNQLLMNPAQFGRFGQAKEYMEEELREQTPEYLQNWDGGMAHLPEFYRDEPVIGWQDGDRTAIADTGLSQFDFANLMSPEKAGESLRTLPGPLVQMLMGLATGKDALGRSVEGPQRSGMIDGALFGKEGGDGTTYTDGRIKMLVDALTGQVNKYDQPFGEQLGSKTYSTESLILQALQQQNRARTDRTDQMKFYGRNIPSVDALELDDIFMEAFSKR